MTLAQIAMMGRVADNLIGAVTGAVGTLVVVAAVAVAAAVAASVDTSSIVVVQHHSAVSVSGMVRNDGVDADCFGFFVQSPVF